MHYNVRDEVFWRKDGTYFPVTFTSTPIKEGGKLVGTYSRTDFLNSNDPTVTAYLSVLRAGDPAVNA